MDHVFFVLGVFSVSKQFFTDEIPFITTFRRLSLPFFIISQTVLVVYLSGAVWVPYLRAMPFTILIVFMISTACCLLVAKSPGLGYFFGLRNLKKDSRLPGKALKGFIPLIVMLMLCVCGQILSSKLESWYVAAIDDE